MLSKHLTDEEIQQLLFDEPASKDEMTEHLRICVDCKAKLGAYKALFVKITEQEKPAFEFNLAELVVAQLPKQKIAKDRLPVFLLVFVMILFAGTGFAFRRYMDFLFAHIASLGGYLMISSVIIILLFFCLDMYKNYQRKMQALDLV